MWRKLVDRRRNRRNPKPSAILQPATPLDRVTRAESPSTITRSPSLPHPTSPAPATQPTATRHPASSPPTPPPPTRSRTDVGTPNDPTTRPQLHRPTPSTPIATTSSPVIAEPTRRRLSLDGELPDAAIRPDGVTEDDFSEGLFEVYPGLCKPAVIDVSACSKAGWEPVRNQAAVHPMHTVEVRKENQDAFCVFAPFRKSITAEVSAAYDMQIFLGVFDGHGAEGRSIAQYARDYISMTTRDASEELGSTGNPIELNRKRVETLKAAFCRAERGLTESEMRIDHVFSGTTAVVAWLFGRDLYTAWTGDSRCVVGRGIGVENGRARFMAVDCSYDQKPVRADEKRRVRNAGGRIARWQKNMGPLRVWLPRDWTPGLAMTRSIGDTVLSEYGVSPVPEVTWMRLGREDEFIVLASDGVWEFMTSQEVVDFIGRMKREGRNASDASEALVREAVRRWRRNEMVVDDTTAVVMWMNWDEEDGEGGGANGGRDGRRDGRKKALLKTKAKVAMKPTSLGVHLVGDDGQLTDFVSKNDLFPAI